MADVVDPVTRSRMMAGIRGKNTKPELLLRKQLHTLGFRYRLHAKTLPGHPDMVLPKWRTVIFVHGCFWHMHGCRLSKLPETRREFWASKLSGNRKRDAKDLKALADSGWRCAVVWECALRGKAAKENLPDIAARLAQWIRNGKETVLEIEGSADAQRN